jgi:hypothetical protein
MTGVPFFTLFGRVGRAQFQIEGNNTLSMFTMGGPLSFPCIAHGDFMPGGTLGHLD